MHELVRSPKDLIHYLRDNPVWIACELEFIDDPSIRGEWIINEHEGKEIYRRNRMVAGNWRFKLSEIKNYTYIVWFAHMTNSRIRGRYKPQTLLMESVPVSGSGWRVVSVSIQAHETENKPLVIFEHEEDGYEFTEIGMFYLVWRVLLMKFKQIPQTTRIQWEESDGD